jgi:hypothetical protein
VGRQRGGAIVSTPELAPVVAEVKTLVLEMRPKFEGRGFYVDVQPLGQHTMGGRRGLLVTATSSDGDEKHMLSIEVDSSALPNVTVKVDGQLRPPADTMFQVPHGKTLAQHLRDRRYFDWFVDAFLAKQPARFYEAR